MKCRLWLQTATYFALFSVQPATAWQQEGHATIAALAERMIGQSAKESIAKLLAEGGDKDLVSIASWADEAILASLGTGPLHGNQEALDFVRRFPRAAHGISSISPLV